MTQKQTKFNKQAGLEKAEKTREPLSSIEDPEERTLERLKRNFTPLR